MSCFLLRNMTNALDRVLTETFVYDADGNRNRETATRDNKTRTSTYLAHT